MVLKQMFKKYKDIKKKNYIPTFKIAFKHRN